jgi:hypothetical protein
LPWLQGWHSFRKQGEKQPYPNRDWDKARNYVIGLSEIGVPLDRLYKHFVTEVKAITESGWRKLTSDPLDPPKDPPCGSCGGGDKANAKAAPAAIPAPRPTPPPPPPKPNNLEEMYQRNQGGPIGKHAAKLRELASQSDRVIELLAKPASSSIFFLAGQPKELTTYCGPQAALYKFLAQFGKPGQFKVEQDPPANLDQANLLYIDKCQTAPALWELLDKYHNKAARWLAIHGTQKFSEVVKVQDVSQPGLLPALRRFMTERPEWSVVYHSVEGFGLTVLGCQARDKPALPSKLTMAVNFTKALARHAMDGAQKVNPRQLEERLELCTICEHRRDERCSVCGCPIGDKAAWRTQQCPLGKWPTRLSPQPEAELQLQGAAESAGSL